jgi:long-chain acyl-CoA synthetase
VAAECLLLTGASGLVGGDLLRLLAAQLSRADRLICLVRRPEWQPQLGPGASCGGPRLEILQGDVAEPRLGLTRGDWSAFQPSLTGILHCAATTRFSAPAQEAAQVNVGGTRQLLDLAAEAPRLRRFGHVSTAFVAGRRSGTILETELAHEAGFVNAYEWSKYEAERLVQASGLPWSIYRLGAILGDDRSGAVRQLNGVHCVIRLFSQGLVPALPGSADCPVDLISDRFAAEAIGHLFARFVPRSTYHVCAGPEHAITVQRFFECCAHGFASVDPGWRHRGIEPPELVAEAAFTARGREALQHGHLPLARAVARLQHFVPQLCYPKRFDCTATLTALEGSGITRIPAERYLASVAANCAARAREGQVSMPTVLVPAAGARMRIGSQAAWNIMDHRAPAGGDRDAGW